MSHRYYFYITQKPRKSQKYIYVTQKSRKSQKDICHTETTEITERYIYVPIDFMSHGNHGNHRKIYFCEILKPVVSYAKKNFSVISVISV